MFVRERVFEFLGAEAPPVVGSRDGNPFNSIVVGGAEVKSYAGFMRLLLATTAETELACLYTGDILPFDITKLMQVDFWAKVNSDTLHASTSLVFGVCSARNNDIDSIAYHASFRAIGSNAIVCESDDGVNDVDDVAAGLNINTSVKRFTLDFASGVKVQVPPPSVGRRANLLFAMDDDSKNLRGVCRSQRYNMENYTGNVQLYAQIQKGAASSVMGTGDVDALHIERIRVRWQGD